MKEKSDQRSDRWVIVGQKVCTYCDQVKALLSDLGISYVYFPSEFGGPLTEFIKACGLTTVPQVYMNGYLIGGYKEVCEYLEPEIFAKTQGDLFERGDPLGR